jgi:TetR/AcrR family transcriptional repressor of uid operon
MTTKTRRQDPALAQNRKNQVLEAASDCFRRKGYHGAGMAEISKTAGMSPGHIYNYFDSKEAIIEAIIQRDMEEMFSVFNGFLQAEGPLLDVMLAGCEDGVDKHLDLVKSGLKLEMISEAARNDKVSQLLQEQDRQARLLMMQLLRREGSLVRDLPETELNARISVMFALFGGLMIRRVLNPALDRDTVLIALKPVLRTLLSPF